jgi:hypothetical protein
MSAKPFSTSPGDDPRRSTLLVAGPGVGVVSAGLQWTIQILPTPAIPNIYIENISASPYTILSKPGWLFLAASASAGADFIANLPQALATGNVAVIKKMDANAHNIVVTPFGTDTIDGANAVDNISAQWAVNRYLDYAAGAWAKI